MAEEGVAEAAFRGKSNLEAVVFPESLVEIGYEAFNDCEQLKHVHLPASLSSIGSEAFGWTEIAEVELPWTTPLDSVDQPFPRGAVVYVPVGSLQAYQADKRWKGYKLEEKADCASNPLSFVNEEMVMIGEKETYCLVLVEKPQRKDPWHLYGVVLPVKPEVDYREAVRRLLFESFRDTAMFLDWEEDRDFGQAQSLAQLLEYDTHRFAVVELPEGASPKTVKLEGRTYLVDEDYYQSVVAGNNIVWMMVGSTK